MQYTSNELNNQATSVALPQAIITADIVGSSQRDQTEWMPLLRNIQKHYNAEVYRGDSFQMRCRNLSDCIYDAIHIKAAIKTVRNLDIRMSIGIGEVEYSNESVAESGGEAFEFSGKGLDKLSKKKDLIAITSSKPSFDEEANVILDLVDVITTRWKPSQAKAMERLLRDGKEWSNNVSQKELASLLKIKPNTLSIQFSQANKSAVMSAEKLLHDKLEQYFSVPTDDTTPEMER